MSSATRHPLSLPPLVMLVAFFVFVVGSGAASSAVDGGPAGGHVGGFSRGGHPGGNFARGRELGGGRFDARRSPHGHIGPRVFVFPYFYEYDPYYGYDPYYPGDPDDSYCDPYSPSYTPQYCYWDYGP